MSKNVKSKNALELWENLAKAYEVVRRAHSKHLYSHKLTGPQFGVLEVLTERGSIPLKRISEQMNVTGANITCVIDNLEKEDLVKRVPSKTDRRVINAEITSKGKQKLGKIFPEHVKNIQEFADKLSENEQKQLAKLLNKLAH
ncbi:HTH-type transcriptional regulator MhqR [bacterium BMS3Abin04]|nr:HTH-type transcriptional regulator MhqR [bacterium BMS3Abin04]